MSRYRIVCHNGNISACEIYSYAKIEMEMYFSDIRACKHLILFKPAAINNGDMLKNITHKIDIGKFYN